MGLEVAAFVMGGAALGKAVSQGKAASAEEAALNLQGEELQLKTQNKTLKNYETMEKILAAQTAHMTTTGAKFSSPSFNAIQRSTVNAISRSESNNAIEGELEQENISAEKKNVRNSLYASLFGDASEVAFQGSEIYNEAPHKTPTGA